MKPFFRIDLFFNFPHTNRPYQYLFFNPYSFLIYFGMMPHIFSKKLINIQTSHLFMIKLNK